MILYAAHSCFVLYKTYGNTNFSNRKIKWKEIFYFEGLSLWYQAYPQVVQECCVTLVWILLIVEFEQENVCWIHIEITNTFGDKIGYITRYVAVFSVWTKFNNKWHLNIYHCNLTGESVRNFWGVYFKR